MKGQGFRPKKAVALRYDRDKDGAPVVAAAGVGQLAEKILSVAAEAGVPVREEPELVEVLARIPLGEEIPVELYQAVAEILAFVYSLSGGRQS